jgi:hypothetical protein
VRREDYLRPLLAARPDRAGRDRLEILAALISSPSFDPLYRDDIIKIPGGHPVYRWECVVSACERPRTGGSDLCSIHQRDWTSQSENGVGKAAFVAAAVGLERRVGTEEIVCRICVKRPAAHNEMRLCQRHLARWDLRQRTAGEAAGFAEWVSQEQPSFSYGRALRWSARIWRSPRWACAPGTAADIAATAARAGPPCRAAGGTGMSG